MSKSVALCALLVMSATSIASATEPPEVRLVIRDHRFVPTELKVPANTKIKLMVVNQDATPEEFESHELNREKVVTGGARSRCTSVRSSQDAIRSSVTSMPRQRRER